jgi:hypothetical protein
MRMNRIALGLIFLLSSAALPLPAQDGWRFFLDGGIDGSFGRTNYDLEFLDPYDPGAGGASRLEFPLDGLGAGAGLTAEKVREGRADWVVHAEVVTNLTDPSGEMADYDWFTRVGFPDAPFSYTESPARMRSLQAALQLEQRITAIGPFGIYLAAGYRFQWARQDIVGYRGWQYIWNENLNGTSLDGGTAEGGYELFGVSGQEKALTYSITYHIPMMGIAARLDPLPGLSLDLLAGFLLPFARDVDDHLLRNKESTGTGFGVGYQVGLGVRYLFSDRARGPAPYIGLEAGLLGLHAPGTQVQVWYADDPSTVEVEANGDRIDDLYHLFTSTQVRIRLTAGVAF